ncbi:inhibitor of growth protein 3 [Arthroderma uncinatum]|uniref:inhibitor of growth protein 3 n=1 Tax=Arthroderma uncinatum TaxID=74035 RepID=UPI00144A6DE4|nr:inhibitor of growth protein 3 [Arthroderma uncinatum]KAF3483924.1 inhibitor of growth protein 3 [Arthroderma uncinatum]
MDRCQILQDEKVILSDKASILLDRHIKRLDVKIRELQNDGLLSNDPPIPSLFQNRDLYREPPKAIFPDAATNEGSYSSPLNPASANANLQFNIAQRLNNVTSRASVGPGAATQAAARNSAPASPAATALHQQRRESSAGAADSKRRRLNTSINTLPVAPSNLRQSSTGPGTPKAGTPGVSRAGSAGPRSTTGVKKPTTKKVAPHQQVRKIKAHNAPGKSTKRSSSSNRLKPVSGNGGSRKKSRSPAAGVADEDEDESMLSSADISDSENVHVSRRQMARSSQEDADDDDDEEGGEDTKTYCTCRSVSHGDMVACDNDNCPYEWFHWKCVGLTREPLGTWYCDECRKNLGK